MEEIKGPKELVFKVKFVYGRYLYYPANDWAERVRKVFNYRGKIQTVSLTRDQVKVFKDLGVPVRTIADEGANNEKH